MGEAWAGEVGLTGVWWKLPALSPACPPVSPPSSDLQGGASAGCISRGFPSASGPPFGSDMDFSPPQAPLPLPIPTKTLLMKLLTCQKASAMARPSVPQTGPHHPTDPACGCSWNWGATGCARPPPVSPSRPFPSDPYGGRGSPSPGAAVPSSLPLQAPLPSSPPLEDLPSLPRAVFTPHLLRDTVR